MRYVKTMVTKEPRDTSTFSKFLAVYSRRKDGVVVCSHNYKSFELLDHWDVMIRMLPKCASVDGVSHIRLGGVDVSKRWYQSDELFVFEFCCGELIHGAVLCDYTATDQWFVHLVLKRSRLEYGLPSMKNTAKSLEIAEFFTREVKNTTCFDQWEVSGQEYFISKIGFFIKRGLPIETVLPAFPCKSSNLEKVAGVMPDKGEELALRRLIQLSQALKKVYEPGWKLFIVSDGHVFGDCIGVDDDVVDRYTEQLKELYRGMNDDEGFIEFVSLRDIFLGVKYSPEAEIPHYTVSKICAESERSRQLLMTSCDTDAGELRRDIHQPNHPRLLLYRGFSRFMCEDLSLNPHCSTMSRSAFKKMVSKIAFEMIKRNDAYSNLVELMFPFHLRLSIHAHVNSGPKFGVKLISPAVCKVIKSLESSGEPTFADLLHIPTPWHNSIFTIEGDDTFYMTKSKIIEDAISQGLYEGDYVQGNYSRGEGGWFSLKKSCI